MVSRPSLKRVVPGSVPPWRAPLFFAAPLRFRAAAQRRGFHFRALLFCFSAPWAKNANFALLRLGPFGRGGPPWAWRGPAFCGPGRASVSEAGGPRLGSLLARCFFLARSWFRAAAWRFVSLPRFSISARLFFESIAARLSPSRLGGCSEARRVLEIVLSLRRGANFGIAGSH